MTFPELTAAEQRYRTNLINSLHGYKSTALCGTSNAVGVHNLAVISSVFHVGATPPLVGMLMRPHTVARHTLENLRETGCYTLNLLHPAILRQAHQCSASYAEGVSEFTETGLTPVIKNLLAAPYVAESRLQMGLQVVEEYTLRSNGCIVVVGEMVELFCADDAILSDGTIDHYRLETVAASSLDSYNTGVPVAKFTYPKPDRWTMLVSGE